MDQSKTNLPHFGPNPSKSMNTIWRIKTHLTGVIVHGQRDAYGYFDLGQYPHDSNMTISILMNVLNAYETLPPTLYLQLDNCGRENKNRFVLAFLSMLVERGIFRKVKLGFLMVGHTHEDIDQMFSCYARHLQRNKAITMDALVAGFEAAYSPRPTGIIVEKVWDFQDWVGQHLNQMENHSFPHQFRVRKV